MPARPPCARGEHRIADMAEGPFRVMSGNRERARVSALPEIVDLVAKGRFFPESTIVAADGSTVPPESIPGFREARIAHDEALRDRSFRALRLFLGLIGLPAGVVSIGAAIALRDPTPLALLVLLFGAFGLPFIDLRTERRRIARARAEGLDPYPPPTPSEMAITSQLRRPPPAIQVTVALIVGVFVAQMALGNDWAFDRFAKHNEAVLRGEIWRLLTAGFLHASFVHLLFNATLLLAVGTTTENVFGRGGGMLILAAGIVSGFVASTLLTTNPSVGISGGLFALSGASVAFGVRARSHLPPRIRSPLMKTALGTLGLNLLLGAVAPFIDNAAHVGGLAAGVALGAVLPPSQALRELMLAGPTR